MAAQDTSHDSAAVEAPRPNRLTPKGYRKELRRLQIELLRLEEWVRHQGLRVVVIFEGRDTAGKGGMIKRITALLNPRFCRVVALPAPNERERTQWYFQRYVAHLPSAGEIVLFDRSWYNRAGVMGFCSDDEYDEFMRTCPQFERMLIRSGIILVKYWLSFSDEEQDSRFRARIDDPTKTVPSWRARYVWASSFCWADADVCADGLGPVVAGIAFVATSVACTAQMPSGTLQRTRSRSGCFTNRRRSLED